MALLLPIPDGFTKPLIAQCARWTNFYRGEQKVPGKANRFVAKCGFFLVSIDGRPELLHKHVTGCTAWSKEEKVEYLKAATVENMQISQNKRLRVDHTETQATETHTRQPSIASWASKPMTPQKANAIHDLLLKAFAFGGIPFTFAKNIFFIQFINALCNSYTIPSSQTLSGRILTEMFSKIVVSKLTFYTSFGDFTICFDGWTDVSGNSIYAFMLLKEESEHVLDILDLSDIRHTAVQLKDEMLSNLASNGILIENALACVTDSPNTMVKLRTDLQEAHPNVVSIRCCLHGFNLVAKDVAGFPKVARVCKANFKLVNYFTASHIRRKELMKWQKEKNVPNYLSTFCETRWYSLCRVCLGVEAYEQGFRHCLELSKTPSYPNITNSEVREIILDRHHFADNECVIKALKPIVDVIGNLEKRTSTLADVLGSVITLYHNARSSHYAIEGLKEHILCGIGKRVQEFEDPIYFVALFLHPFHKSMAISAKYEGDAIVEAALALAKNWNFDKRDATVLCKELINYKNGDPPFDGFKGMRNQSGRKIWETFCGSSFILRRIAMKIFSIVPHGASCERLFSILGIMKTKPQNRLSVDKLNMLAQIKCDLASEVFTKKKTSAVSNDFVQGTSMADFDASVDEDCGHELLGEEIEVVQFGSAHTEMKVIEDFFDFLAFARDNENIDAEAIIEENNLGTTIPIDKSWSTDDLFEECS